jgi:hypothetical protein
MIPPAAVRLSPAIVRFSTCLSRNRHPSTYTCGHLIKVNVKPSRFARGVCDFVNPAESLARWPRLPRADANIAGLV